jgi:hypothetical protein
VHSDDDSADVSVLEIDGVVIATVAQETLDVDNGRLRRLLDEHRAATVIGLVPPAMSLSARRAACSRAVELLISGVDVDAVCAVVAVTDAIKRVSNGIVVETVARDDLRWARAPAFVKRSVVERVLTTASTDAATISLLPTPPATVVVLRPSKQN